MLGAHCGRIILSHENSRSRIIRCILSGVATVSTFSHKNNIPRYTLSEAWSGVNWADLIAAQGAFGTNFYDRSTRTIVGTMLWTEYRPVIKIGPKVALGSHEIRSIHSAPSLGQSIVKYPCIR